MNRRRRKANDGDTLTRYQALQEKAAELQSEHDRAQGQYDAAMAALQEEFGVDTLAAGQELLEQLRGEAADTASELEDAIAEFEQTYGEQLGDTTGGAAG